MITDDQLAQRLRTTGGATLPPESHDRLRRVVLSEFDRVTTTRQSRWKWGNPFVTLTQRNPMIPALIAIVLLVTATGTAVASDSAKPGDALYGIDRSLEAAKFTVVFGDDALATYLQELAEERAREYEALRASGDEHADDAHRHALDALERVRIRLEHNQASDEARLRIEQRVDELRVRFELDDDSDDSTNASGLTEAEAKIHGQTTTLQYEYNDQKATITLQTTSVDEIVTALATLLGISEEEVRAELRVETTDEDESSDDSSDDGTDNSGSGNGDEGDDSDGNSGSSNDDEDGDDRSNGNTNQSQNANENRNRNTNSDDASDESDDNDNSGNGSNGNSGNSGNGSDDTSDDGDDSDSDDSSEDDSGDDSEDNS